MKKKNTVAKGVAKASAIGSGVGAFGGFTANYVGRVDVERVHRFGEDLVRITNADEINRHLPGDTLTGTAVGLGIGLAAYGIHKLTRKNHLLDAATKARN